MIENELSCGVTCVAKSNTIRMAVAKQPLVLATNQQHKWIPCGRFRGGMCSQKAFYEQCSS